MKLFSTLFSSGAPASLLSILFLLLLAPVLAAAAGPLPHLSHHRRTTEWTITSMRRICDAATSATSCQWRFGINRNDGSAITPCAFTVLSSRVVSSGYIIPANESPATHVTCGAYRITSGWSGQFGADKGFTTLSVVDEADGLVVYPAYGDVDLAGGAVVVPDRKYAPEALH